ncbi:MAG: alpha-ketoglutarate-dependent dioxygenase AlkB [Ilumatobacteraceae bacterium]
MSANGRSPTLQGSLLGLDDPAVDPTFTGLRRTALDDRTWLEHLPGWLAGHEEVFDRLYHDLDWQQRTVTMYQRRLPEPRLTSWWVPSHGPEALPVLGDIRTVLSARYGEAFDSIGFNCYRDGTDSVAWHGDRHRETVDNPIVVIVSVGAPRPLRLRPRGGGKGRALSFDLGRGDLFVMGGACQHDWEHCVPKVRHAEPRISITYRHGAR